MARKRLAAAAGLRRFPLRRRAGAFHAIGRPLLSSIISDVALALGAARCFDHVLVVEYQDTNRLQSSILLTLKPEDKGLIALRAFESSTFLPA
jgi:superfamily I DNA/RNA helicase